MVGWLTMPHCNALASVVFFQSQHVAKSIRTGQHTLAEIISHVQAGKSKNNGFGVGVPEVNVPQVITTVHLSRHLTTTMARFKSVSLCFISIIYLVSRANPSRQSHRETSSATRWVPVCHGEDAALIGHIPVQLRVNNVLQRARFPTFVNLTKQELGVEVNAITAAWVDISRSCFSLQAAAIMEELLTHGRMGMDQAVQAALSVLELDEQGKLTVKCFSLYLMVIC